MEEDVGLGLSRRRSTSFDHLGVDTIGFDGLMFGFVIERSVSVPPNYIKVGRSNQNFGGLLCDFKSIEIIIMLLSYFQKFCILRELDCLSACLAICKE